MPESISKHGVLSRSLLQSLARGRQNDPSAFTAWRAELRQRIRVLGIRKDIGEVPYFNVRTGTPIVPNLLKLPVSNLLSRVYQIYDPLTGLDGIVVEQQPKAQVTAADYDYVGRINHELDGQTFRFYPSERTPGVALTFINSELHLVAEPRGQPAIYVKLDKAVSALPDHFSYAAVLEKKLQEDEEPADLVLIISSETGDQKKTEFLLLHPVAATYKLLRRFAIDTNYYDESELNERLVGLAGQTLFDNLTPKQESVEAYRQARQETIPYVNLSQSVTGKPLVQSYVKPLEEKAVNTFIKYRVYDHRGAREKQTGLYFLDAENYLKNRILGGLLKKEMQTHLELSSKTLTTPQQAPSGRLSLIALDGGFGDGTNGFKLVLAVNYDGGIPDRSYPLVW